MSAARDLELYKRIAASRNYDGTYRKALDILDGALRLYGVDGLVLSFNGGKDATVMLHLTRAAVAAFQAENGQERSGAGGLPVKCAYFIDNKSFAQMDEFVATMEGEHGLSLERYEGGYKDGCQHMKDKFGSQAFLLGTRKSDPHGQFVEGFSPSTKGWPAFMRVHPILSWDYQDVWRFLVEFSLPYCKLYDDGYTSLGSRFDTEKNPALLRPDGTYRPAHTLVLKDDQADLERSNRKVAEEPCSPGPGQGCSNIGFITIGDEVLSAKVLDLNTGYACGEMRKKGIVPKKAVILPDDLEEIARFVKEMASTYTAVITMGGIGPTHDDMTLKGVAKGLGVPLVHNTAMEHFLHSKTRSLSTVESEKLGLTCSTMRMCIMPDGTELLMEDGKEYPLLRCQNVYMLPGVPQFMREQLAHVGRILGCGRAFVARKIGYSLDESMLAEAIADTASRCSEVAIGVYPYYGDVLPEGGARTVVVVEGTREEEVRDAVEMLLSLTPVDDALLFNVEGSSLAGGGGGGGNVADKDSLKWSAA